MCTESISTEAGRVALGALSVTGRVPLQGVFIFKTRSILKCATGGVTIAPLMRNSPKRRERVQKHPVLAAVFSSRVPLVATSDPTTVAAL
eukprot:1178060-Prorocentrum_minimum.AAC.2